MPVKLGSADIAVMVVLFGLTIAKAVWVSTRGMRRMHSRDGGAMTPEDFFLAGRSMPFWAVGLSIFASNIGTEHFVGQAGTAAASGMPVAVYEWSAGLLIFFLGFYLAPRYIRERLVTMPEWFERRYGPRCRLLLAVVSVASYVLTKIASGLFAGAVLMEVVLGVTMWTSVPVILLLTGLYAASGGLSAVMFTDVGQATIFLVGGFIGMCYALSQIGGPSGIVDALNSNGLSYFTATMRPGTAPEHSWTGLLIGQPIASTWYWCVDQVIVQRVFSAKSTAHAQAGCALAGYLKILPPFLMVIPGIIARCFFEECQRTTAELQLWGAPENLAVARHNSPTEILHPEWCDTGLDNAQNANKAYPLLIIKSFPDGLRGMMIVAMVLAMMSSLDSVFNCTSTVVTEDLYVRFWNPGASARRQIWVGRLVTVIAAAIGMAWLPMIAANTSGLYMATQSVMTHLSPTIVAVFMLGLWWPRANGYGAMAGMIAGFALGTTRYVMTHSATCGTGEEWYRQKEWATWSCMDFNHMAVILFVFAAAVTVVASLLAERALGKQRVCEQGAEAPASGDVEAEGLSPSHRARAAGEDDDAAAPGPIHPAEDSRVRQRLLVSGVLLLAVMLVLCVGFGYASVPERWNGVTISGGVLAIASLGGSAVLANFAMLAAEWRRGSAVEEQKVEEQKDEEQKVVVDAQ